MPDSLAIAMVAGFLGTTVEDVFDAVYLYDYDDAYAGYAQWTDHEYQSWVSGSSRTGIFSL